MNTVLTYEEFKEKNIEKYKKIIELEKIRLNKETIEMSVDSLAHDGYQIELFLSSGLKSNKNALPHKFLLDK